MCCSQQGVSVRTWPDLSIVSSWDTESPNLHDLAFSPNGNLLAVAGGIPGETGTVELFDWPKGKRLKTLNVHDDSTTSVAWIDDTTFMSAGLDHQVMIVDAESGKLEHTLSGHSSRDSGLLDSARPKATCERGNRPKLASLEYGHGRTCPKHVNPRQSSQLPCNKTRNGWIADDCIGE